MHTTSLKNSRSESIRFWLEPWAEEYEVPSGSTLKLSYECAKPTMLYPEVEVTETLIVWWFGSGCRVRVYVDGKEVTAASWRTLSPNL